MRIAYIASSDEEMLTKIQYAFDLRLNSWLEDIYEHSDSLLDVDHSQIDFIDIIQMVTHGSFTTSLPLSLQPSPNKKRPAEDTPETPGQPTPKDPKQKQKKGATNPEPNRQTLGVFLVRLDYYLV
jgi:hypothetical protein